MEKKLISISELAHACGVSRMTIRRLCDKGLISTSNDAKPGEAKKYSYKDVLRLERILSLQRCGVTQKEMQEHLKHPGDYSTLFEQMRIRYKALESMMMELELYSSAKDHILIMEETVPAMTLYTKEADVVSSYKDVIGFLCDTLEEAVRENVHLELTPSLYLIDQVKNHIELTKPGEIRRFTAGVPILDDDPPVNAVVIPECRAVTLLLYGKYPKDVSPVQMVSDELKKKGLKPDGRVIISFICDSSLEYHLSEDNALLKCIIPVANK